MSELEQTIEELEAEVLAELEEGQHAKSDPQMKVLLQRRSKET